VQWDPDDHVTSMDTQDCMVFEEEEVGERTLVQESENNEPSDTGLEFSLKFEEDSTDDDEQQLKEAQKVSPDGHPQQEAWRHLQEMSVELSEAGFLLENTTIPQEVPRTRTIVESEPSPHTLQNHPTKEEKAMTTTDPVLFFLDPLESSMALSDNRLDDSNLFLEYTLQNDMVTIPELGTYKRKEYFSALATDQMIRKMLSQSILPHRFLNNSVK
jgi:hypothetical protein